MPEPAIEVHNVSKVFRKHLKQISLRQEARSLIGGLLRPNSDSRQEEPFYALRDVSFTVQRGEAVALVGRNGSGKTTLIRLMTRIMRPTAGLITVRGRYSALIGLGAGFLPTMTGRENIYLNAAIHGVPPQQTDTLLEKIIAFADIGDFIDIPVKDYSSGMGARLGFSVAIHILPETIFLDEVLAVGDAAFQAKCLERILEMKNSGKTIIFVSHSAGAVTMLCERAIWLDKGRVEMDSDSETVIEAYSERYGGRQAFDQ
ncbi:MAG: ABC transporter ATP-binding protein [Anaerolineae bacterium]|nr:ABC transporter ATP-binding protein [Anaerolineae bacterium]